MTDSLEKNRLKMLGGLWGGLVPLVVLIAVLFGLSLGGKGGVKTFWTAGWLALLITLGRFSGKLFGSRLGAQISHAPDTVKKYLGLGLLPTAGVTVGLVLLASELFGPSRTSEVMVSAVLGSVIISELLSPFLVRYGLTRAGETKLR